MKVKIQKTDGTITFERIRPHRRNLKKNMAEMRRDLFETAELFFETFPRIKEIVFNTELTEDDE